MTRKNSFSFSRFALRLLAVLLVTVLLAAAYCAYLLPLLLP